jgi:DNA-binding winged helix-turn-helix (wHTH) protein
MKALAAIGIAAASAATAWILRREYDVLKLLVRYSDRVLTHRQIIREIWGGGRREDKTQRLRVNISNLRRKLEADPTRPRHIVTEPGVGYRLRNIAPALASSRHPLPCSRPPLDVRPDSVESEGGYEIFR